MRTLWILCCGLLMGAGTVQAQKNAPTENEADRKPALITNGRLLPTKAAPLLTVTQGT